LFPPGDPQGLADAVVDILGDPSLTQKGVKARQNVVEHWSNDRLVDRHIEIYQRLISERK
jgi:glycosyltransferase involved in cell wall biosynthesis